MSTPASSVIYGNELPRSRAARYPVGKVLSPVHPRSKLRGILRQNKVGITLIDPENISVITIENQKVADSYIQAFEALWR